MKKYIHSATNLYPIEVVPDANDDDDNPTCWAVKIYDSEEDEDHCIWITKYEADDSSFYYVVEDSTGHNLAKGLQYKTFAGARKKAFEVATFQESHSYYTD